MSDGSATHTGKSGRMNQGVMLDAFEKLKAEGKEYIKLKQLLELMHTVKDTALGIECGNSQCFDQDHCKRALVRAVSYEDSNIADLSKLTKAQLAERAENKDKIRIARAADALFNHTQKKC